MMSGTDITPERESREVIANLKAKMIDKKSINQKYLLPSMSSKESPDQM